MTALSAPAQPSIGLDADYYRAQQRIVRAAVDQAQTAWTQLDPRDPSASWVEEIRPQVVTAVEEAQQESAALAPLYIAGTLLAAGAVSAPLALLVASAFVGMAANGLVLSALMDFAFGYYRRAKAADVPETEARALGLAKLLTYVATETNDTARLAVHVGAVVEPDIAGYERVVTLPACGRCILLSGRLYRFSTGFLRHPNCDCSMRPVTSEQWREGGSSRSPQALFDGMTRAQQDKAFGKGEAAAIRAGADIGRVVNARRRNQVYVAGGYEFTREATTTRGIGRQLGELAKRGGRYRRSQVPRPTAAQLVNAVSQDQAELIRQLRRFGYLR
ncbi:hypothetical protein ALI22I_23365 [Saccharothrix sp. ALI-22-I]|uniref:hypothetical protein n=1 Tax=Saccharothrix sp. ALI-22-I TaxID=1933778 RepID=UPI00097C5ABF|nr:hypothetical protein [Saccharothrix sp. ALI-22-I]ONI87362.1 hypothetical protein ALI22I_23365 [Saccharothrix sp. ALI-22-I]